MSLAAFESRWFDQKGGNDAVNPLQQRREQIGMGGEEETQRDRRDDIVDQVGRALRHTPRPARGDPRRLQENATSFSWPQSPQRNL